MVPLCQEVLSLKTGITGWKTLSNEPYLIMIFDFDLVKVVEGPVQCLYEYTYKMHHFSSYCYSRWGLSWTWRVSMLMNLWFCVDFRGQSVPADHWDVLKTRGKDGWMDGRIEWWRFQLIWEIQSTGMRGDLRLVKRNPLYIERVTFGLFHCFLV